MLEVKTVYFENPGKENTDEVLRIAKRRARELGIKTIVVATTTGDTGAKAVKVFKGIKVITVTRRTGSKGPNVQELTDENREKIESEGGTVLTATHVFSSVSESFRKKFNMYSLDSIILNTLRIFGQGMKVVPEIAMMAADAGVLRTDEDIISIAGTGRGADTAIVLKPVNSGEFFDLKIREILCKPHF